MPQENYIKITFGKRMALNHVVQQKALLYAVKHVIARQFELVEIDCCSKFTSATGLLSYQYYLVEYVSM